MRRLGIAIPAAAAALAALWAAPAAAQEATVEVTLLNGANTAWLLTSTALVLFMTLPGLALFYGGLVRGVSVLSVLMHCFAIACLVSVLWLIFVYGLAFGDGGPLQAWIGGFGKAFLGGTDLEAMSGDVPETVFFMFQMTFAIITPALVVGAYVERIKFSAVLWFSGLWLIVVYAPIAHWVWGGGWLADMGILDFAGGLVVHLSCGISALIAAIMIGGRKGFPSELNPPHAPGLTMMGACMLWVGWFGFNAGSALAADANAGMAMLVTHVSAATASLVWMVIEWAKFGKPSLVGIVTGMVAGLATITPASGFVGPVGGLVIGFAGGVICYVLVSFVKQSLKIDDSLDVFAVHGIGGATGILLTAIFGAPALGGLGLSEGATIGSQLWVQFVGIVAVVVWAGVLSWILLLILRATIGLRVSTDQETEGLDLTAHGESAYNW